MAGRARFEVFLAHRLLRLAQMGDEDWVVFVWNHFRGMKWRSHLPGHAQMIGELRTMISEVILTANECE